MSTRHRRPRGNMLVLSISIMAAIFVPVLMLFSVAGPFFLQTGRAQNVVEAAALLAANDLARIVITDPSFGYVSLSNHPPTGKATLAPDGEPLPVAGINTLIGTLRQNAIIAEELNNETMQAMVDSDHASLTSTIAVLNKTLSEAVSMDTRKRRCMDINGATVTPFEDVEKFLQENLPNDMQLESVNLSLGWLLEGNETTVPVPKPLDLARVHPNSIHSGQYEAFTNHPVGSRNFTFAGLGHQSHLVSTRSFQDADDKHICSIVKVECTLVSRREPHTRIQCVACSQPFSRPDSAPRGSMTVRFAGRPVPGILSWNDFLTNVSFQDNRITTYKIINGDFPYERRSRMRETSHDERQTTSAQFAEHLYCWLRCGRLRPRIDAVLAMVNEPFRSCLNEVYTYEFADDGSVTRCILEGSRFTRPCTADGQFASMADTRVKSGANAVVIFRNNVRRLGTRSGKHGGQPLVGYPLTGANGCTQYDQLALEFSRRSVHPSGLALDIEIGGTADSTARQDVASMRQRTRGRLI